MSNIFFIFTSHKGKSMNINTDFGQATQIGEKAPHIYVNEAQQKEDFKNIYDKTQADNESLVDHVNMPIKEKEALRQTLNEMDANDKSITLMTLMAPSSMDATPESEFLDYDEIMKRIDNILNPPLGGKPSGELQEALTVFKELFDKNFSKVSEQNEQNKNIKERENQLAKAKFLSE